MDSEKYNRKKDWYRIINSGISKTLLKKLDSKLWEINRIWKCKERAYIEKIFRRAQVGQLVQHGLEIRKK